MWVMVMFDLPTDTKEARSKYRLFRESLLDFGYTMLQFSVYSRAVPSEESAIAQVNRVKALIPDDGEVRMIALTDKQYAKMEVFLEKYALLQKKHQNNSSFFREIKDRALKLLGNS